LASKQRKPRAAFPAPEVTKRKRRGALIEELEPRILHSADTNPLAVAVPAAVHARTIDTAGEFAAAAATATAQSTVAEHARHEVVFVDTNTPEYQKLVDDIRARSGDERTLDVVLLNDKADGIAQISHALAGRHDIDAIHLVSHGADGEIQIGGATLNFDSLIRNAAQIKGWGQALAQGADLMIYGCDVAQTGAGQSLVDALSRLTGADVAASENLTGAAALGGDWTLEYQDGAIQTQSAISQSMQLDWNYTLATFTVTSTNDAGAGSLRAAITRANGTVGTDTIAFNIAGAGVQTITLASALPTISDAVILDGWTQGGAGYHGTPLIEISGNNAVGGMVITAGNSTVRGLIINRMTADGLQLNTAGGNTVVGNWFGLNSSGTAAAANGQDGMQVSAGSNSNTIGGVNSWERNVFSGNTDDGLEVKGNTNLVYGNWFGLNATGTGAVGNIDTGLTVSLGASNNQIGGTAAGQGNVMSGNAGVIARGISITDSTTLNNTFQGNIVGLDPTATFAIANTTTGIEVKTSAGPQVIGGTVAGAGNIVSGNGGAGVTVALNSTGVAIEGNSIYGNGGIGIDLGVNGVTANDTNDIDTGANTLQNFPVLTNASSANGTTNVQGTLNSVASKTYRIEFFANTAADASGNGEGQRYLGFTTVTTNGGGNASFNVNLAGGLSPTQKVISATATDPTNNTSEFSATVTATVTNTAPVLSGANALTAIDEDVNSIDNTGTLVSAIIAGKATDADFGTVLGIAVTNGSSSKGFWEYTTNGGATWLDLSAASTSAARLLSGNALTRIRFLPNPNFNGTVGGLTFRAWDGTTGVAGSTANITASGGTSAFSGATASPSIVVNSVNDAPLVSGVNYPGVVYQGAPVTLAMTDFSFSDAIFDSPVNNIINVIIDSAPSYGVLTLNNNPVVDGQVIPVAAINAGGLVYTADLAAATLGSGGFTYRVQDDGGTAFGGVDISVVPAPFVFSVVQINSPPQGQDATVRVSPGGSHVFGPADFFYTDTNVYTDALQAVIIDTLPAAGSLTVAGNPVVAGQSIAAASLANGDFVFTADPSASGAGYANFTFQIQDAGGTALGGVDTDPTPNTITVDIVVNQAPAGTDNTVTAFEDTPYTFAAADFGFQDPNDTPANVFSAVVISTPPGAGTLMFNGSAVTVGQSIPVTGINAGLLKFTPAANANGAGYTSFTFQVQDSGSTANGGANLDPTPNTITMNVTAVNDAPVITRNVLTVAQGATVKLNATDLAATDVDNAAASLVFSVSAVQHGRFELSTSPGVAILSFTQAQLTSGIVRFVHDGSSSAPKYDVSVSDGSLASAAAPAAITFNPTPAHPGGGVVPPGQGGTPPGQTNKGGGTNTPPGQTGGVPGNGNANGNGKGGSTQGGHSSGSQNTGSGDAGSDAVATNQVPDTTTPAAGGAGRGGFGPPGVVTASVPGMAMRWGGVGAQHLNGAVGEGAKPLFQDIVLQIDTKPVEHHAFTGNATTDWSISNAFVNQAKLPERELVPILLDNAQIGGVALSVGVVWWASRITGVLGSVLASAPAWEELDPLPVTDIVDERRDEEEHDDPQAEADEEAVGMVLEGPTAKA
jgi:hypothetical protein